MNAPSIRRAALVALCGAACLAAQAVPVIYPSRGQTNEQTDRDKFACFEWSRSQSGFDPLQTQAQMPAHVPAGSPSTATPQGSTAGMVKGAAGGAAVAELADRDAGKGAAVGLLGAAMRGRMQQQQQQQQQAAQAQQLQQQQQQQQQQAARQLQQQRSTFDRAFGACMEGRGYVVK